MVATMDGKLFSASHDQSIRVWSQRVIQVSLCRQFNKEAPRSRLLNFSQDRLRGHVVKIKESGKVHAQDFELFLLLCAFGQRKDALLLLKEWGLRLDSVQQGDSGLFLAIANRQVEYVL